MMELTSVANSSNIIFLKGVHNNFKTVISHPYSAINIKKTDLSVLTPTESSEN